MTIPELVTWPVVPLRDHVIGIFSPPPFSHNKRNENCVYQVSTIILGQLLAAVDYCFMFNLVSLRRVKNINWSSLYFEGTWKKKKLQPYPACSNGADISRAYCSSLQAAILSVKPGRAQTCFIMNQAQNPWINFHLYSVYLDRLPLKS